MPAPFPLAGPFSPPAAASARTGGIPPKVPKQARKQSSAPCQVVWFKRDLRVYDNAALSSAAIQGPVLPIYIAEPLFWREEDASQRQWEFIAESLFELRAALAALGAPLVIRTGDATSILDEIHREDGIAALWSHQETGNGWTYDRDKRVLAWCKANGILWHQPRQNGVIRALTGRNGWAKSWDAFMSLPTLSAPILQPANIDVLAAGQIPQARDLGIDGEQCEGRQQGGRQNALFLLDSFLNARGMDYRRAMSSPLTAESGCSRLSPHLAWGTISMRETAQAARRQSTVLKAGKSEDARRWSGALASFSGRLHWHCHFIQKLESEPRIEFENMHPAYDEMRPFEPDRTRLHAWAKGETGFPFADACMRSLAATGWINFRMRAMLMAFASYQLWLPWRSSGLALARLFTDYEPGIHWPQTQMQSGTTGINTLRIYNPVKQGYDQDPQGVFVRRWIPELRCIPDAYIHEPWKWLGFASPVGKSYPERIVDHNLEAKAARNRIWEARRGDAFRRTADAIQEKHGSRKSGLPRAGHRKKRPASANKQLSFDL